VVSLRAQVRKVESVRTLEGAGFRVRRPFPTFQVDHFGPFLLLDEMGPADNAPGEARGAPDHPHRGFETVTYMLDGELEHRDSVGNRGLILPGDVQWMTAGAGIVHSEMPSQAIMSNGGRTHGFQLWVNLPANAKMRRPRYQELTRDDFPVVDLDGGRLVVVSGRAFDVTGPAETHVPITYAHLSLEPRGSTSLDLDPGSVAFVYVFRGDGEVGDPPVPVRGGDTVLFDEGPGRIHVAANDGGLDAMIGAGPRLDDPVVRYGPFVMNTRAEIAQAIVDYQSGKMGSIEPEGELRSR
jgi:redox-sensitive bicupin YhaK (pirin superfamily)